MEEYSAGNLLVEFLSMQQELGFVQQVDCSVKETEEFSAMVQEGKSLPSGVISYLDYRFYRLIKSELSKEERDEIIQYRQTLLLKSIKNMLTFFVALTILSIICALFIIILNFT